jgi:hypothetical protein
MLYFVYREPPVIQYLRWMRIIRQERRELHPTRKHTWSQSGKNLYCWCGVRAQIRGFNIEYLDDEEVK